MSKCKESADKRPFQFDTESVIRFGQWWESRKTAALELPSADLQAKKQSERERDAA